MKFLFVIFLLVSSICTAQTLETGSNSFTTNNAAFYPAATISLPVNQSATIEVWYNTIAADGQGAWTQKLMRSFLRKPNGQIIEGATTWISAWEGYGTLGVVGITIKGGIISENGTIKIAFYGQQQKALNTKITWIITRR